MKKLRLQYALLALVFVFTITACSSGETITIPSTSIVGDFSGYYTLNPNNTEEIAEENFNFSFQQDGSLKVSLGDNLGSGTYSQSANEVTGTYKFTTNTQDFSFKGDVSGTGANQVIGGLWYTGASATGTASGYFKIEAVQ